MIAALLRALAPVAKPLHKWGHFILPWLFVLCGVVLSVGAYFFGSVRDVCVNADRPAPLANTAGPLSGSAPLPDPFLFVLGAVAVFLGRQFSKLNDDEPVYGPQSKESVAVTHKALFIVIVAFAVFWFIEAMGTARVQVFSLGRAEAITFYIRCAIMLDKLEGPGRGVISASVIFLICFVAGHWLWAAHRKAT